MKRKIQATFGLSLAALTLVVLSCSSYRHLASPPQQALLTDKQLNKLLAEIAPWPDGSTSYSNASWKHLISAAKYVQECDPASIEKTLFDYQNASVFDRGVIRLDKTNDDDQVLTALRLKFAGSEKKIEDDGKLLLLMRTVFDLPERAPVGQKVNFFGWTIPAKNVSNGKVIYSDENRDGTINIAWPIVWNGGKPKLLSGETSLQGVVDVYNVLGEYKYFRARYTMRNLKGVKP